MAREDFHYEGDSLERVEHLLAIEAAVVEKIRNDRSLSSAQREELIREVECRIDAGDFPEGEDWNDDDALAILVRKPGPKAPRGKLGAAVRREPESEDTSDPVTPKSITPELTKPSTDSRSAML